MHTIQDWRMRRQWQHAIGGRNLSELKRHRRFVQAVLGLDGGCITVHSRFCGRSSGKIHARARKLVMGIIQEPTFIYFAHKRNVATCRIALQPVLASLLRL